jgi:elongation of very long chain fatty acids protein 4
MIYKAVLEYIAKDYKFICNGYDASATGMAGVVWIFYLSKIFDFCDTFFIVMRRKWKQLSFLHVYHHTSIFLVSPPVSWHSTLASFRPLLTISPPPLL